MVNRRPLQLLPLAIAMLVAFGGNLSGQDAETTKNKSQSSTKGYLRLTSGPITLSIDPLMAGRIASMTYEGEEVLKTTRDENNWHWGSTVWVAPQSDWRWPPSTVIDSEPYTVVSAEDSKIVVRSKVDQKTGFQITKRFELRQRANLPVATMTYLVHNRSQETKKVALWENTRVVWDGVTRFPSGTKIRLANEDQPIVMKENKSGISIAFNDKQPNSQKVFCTPPAPADGARTWNSFRIGDLLLTKSRQDPGKVAPGQSPLEIYFGKDAGFAELEYQGTYETLAPGESASMVVFWRLRKLEPKP